MVAAHRDRALDLGDITSVTKKQTLNGVDERVDYFRFTLTTPRKVSLGLHQLDAGASLTLEDDRAGVIMTRSKKDVQQFSFSATVLEGAYYVRVEATQEAEERVQARPPDLRA